MDILNIVLLVLSILIPILFIYRSDMSDRKGLSILEVVSVYPLFIVLYLGARVYMAYSYYFVEFWATIAADFSEYPQIIILTSKLIVFFIDLFCWYIFSRSKFIQQNLKIGTMIVFTLSEAALLMLIGMVIPVFAEGILEMVLSTLSDV